MIRHDNLEGQIRAVLAADAGRRRLIAVRTYPAVAARIMRIALNVSAAVLLVVAALTIGSALRELRSAPAAQPQSTAVSTPSAQDALATPAPTTPAAAAGFPICPPGQAPLLDVVQTPPPGDQPGSGAASPEAAFTRANPTLTDYAMYQFGTVSPYVPERDGGLSGPVWIVAGSRTFISLYLGSPGQNSWFAHPATFVRCMTQQDLQNPKPNSPSSSPNPDGTRG